MNFIYYAFSYFFYSVFYWQACIRCVINFDLINRDILFLNKKVENLHFSLNCDNAMVFTEI